MLVEQVTIGEGLAAFRTGNRLLALVQLLNVNLQIGLSRALGRAQLALEFHLVRRVNQTMSFHAVALGEPLMTEVTFVWFLWRITRES